MSLKRDFIDMLKLIAPQITEDSYEEDYTVEEDFVMSICELTGEDVAFASCYDCEHCSNSIRCEHSVHKKVDVYLWSGGNESRAYVFNKKLEHPGMEKRIKRINNRKQLLAEMSVLKEEFDSRKNAYAEYAERIVEYKKYIPEFVEKVKCDFPLFRNINCDLIPAVFNGGYRKDHDWNSNKYTVGDFQTHGIQSIVNVYNSWNTNMDEVKETIRHEILHYMLWCINPLVDWNKDDSGVFHYFCGLYDAGAYKKMNEDNQMVYEDLKGSNKEEVNMLLMETLKRMNLKTTGDCNEQHKN